MNNLDAIIDSSVLLSYKSGDPFTKNLMFKAIDEEISLGITAFSLFIIWSSSDFDRKSEIGFMSLIEYLTIIEITLENAKNAGNILRTSGALTKDIKSIEKFFIQEFQNQYSKIVITDSASNYDELKIDLTDPETFIKANQTTKTS